MMENEHENLAREVIKAILFHAKPSEMGWRSQFVLTFTEDERKAMERICIGDDND